MNILILPTIRQNIHEVLDKEWIEDGRTYNENTEEGLDDFFYWRCNHENSLTEMTDGWNVFPLGFCSSHFFEMMEYVNTENNDLLGEDITYKQISDKEKLLGLVLYFIGDEWRQKKQTELNEKVYVMEANKKPNLKNNNIALNRKIKKIPMPKLKK